jgi:hypothetical protein
MAMNFVINLIHQLSAQLDELIGPPSLYAVAAVFAVYVFIVFTRSR